MNAAVALYIYGLVPEFLMRFLAWLLIHTFYRVDKSGLENIPDEGPLRRRLQPRELRGRRRHRRVRAAARALRDGSPHLPRPRAVVHLPHDAHDPDRAGQGRCADEGPCVREAEGGARRRGDRRHFSRGQADRDRRAQPVPAGCPADRSRPRLRCPSCRWRCPGCGAAFSAVRRTARRCAAGGGSIRGSRSSSRRRSRRRTSRSTDCRPPCLRCAVRANRPMSVEGPRWRH